MDASLNTIHNVDCVAGMRKLPAGSVDLAFADPPFNIGYDYDVYQDRVKHQEYIDWSHNWIAAVYRTLKDDGAFWLAIGDEYAAELKLESQKIGFHCRSWVIWYYTFGVNCSKKFTRSHVHMFHFVKDPQNFTFRDDDLDNRIPSARQLVYNDKRANPRGRLPDDTWIIRPAGLVGELVADDAGTWTPAELPPPADKEQTYTLRPQDVEQCFQSSEDTWYFPRVAGTFKERAGFHGCQMPEQLLARIIRTCSETGELVLDPFSGSATTLAVAKKLGRQYVGYDVSKEYIRFGLERLDGIHVGDPPDGTPEPLMSAPKTDGPRRGKKQSGKGVKRSKSQPAIDLRDTQAKEKRYSDVQLELTLKGIVECFEQTHDGFSTDRVVADPELNQQFADACSKRGLFGDARTWNTLLFRLRKAGRLSHVETGQRTSISWEDCDEFMFGSEIALQLMLDDDEAESLDEILCDPFLAVKFDKRARKHAPGYTPLEYRWAALKLRKEARNARSRASVLTPPSRYGKKNPADTFEPRSVEEAPGVYVVSDSAKRPLYVGEALNLRNRLKLQFGRRQKKIWAAYTPREFFIQSFPTEKTSTGRLAWQSCLIKKYKQKPPLNYSELRSPV